jgi:hypothetical protein
MLVVRITACGQEQRKHYIAEASTMLVDGTKRLFQAWRFADTVSNAVTIAS